jgi:succinate dehydrogenase / fumarate reductase iron-sulfur subunit
MKTIKVSVYRYNPEVDNKPYYQDYDVVIGEHDTKLLQVLNKIKDDYDDTVGNWVEV